MFVKVTSNKPVTVTATLEGRTIRLYSNNQAYWGVFGVARTAPLGARAIGISARDALGVTVTGNAAFEVVNTPFATFRLDFAPTAFDPTDFVKEREFLTPIWNTISAAQLWSGLFARPIKTDVTSAFGEIRIWKDGSRDSHEGVDFNGKVGDLIVAGNDGMVVVAQPLVVRGNVVIIDHGLGIYTGYYHLSEILVKKGDAVQKGQIIGKLGSTGRVTGPHLHWDMVVNGVNVDALDWTEKEYSTK